MNAEELLMALEDAVENDEKLNSWCESELGRLPHIMIGYDAVKPPLKGSYPLIILFDISSEKEDIRMITSTRQISVSCGIYNSKVSTTDRKIKYEGMIQAESFREQIAQAVFRKFLGKITITPLGTESLFPLFASGMNISVKFSYKIETGE